MTRLPFLTSMLMLLLLVYACQTENNNAANANDPDQSSIAITPAEKKGIEYLDKCITAHGGMEAWNKFVGLSYVVENSGKSLYQLTHLKDRRTYSKTDDFELGSDGKKVWVTPNADKVPGKSAAFYYNLDFYFIAIPFVLKDPGVKITYIGKATTDGETYDLLKVSYEDGVGLSAEDLYFLYLDATNHQLRILTYTVSYFDKTNDKVNSAKKYLDYQNIQGVLMPAKLAGYRWIDGKMGENSNRNRIIHDYKFYEVIEDESIFQVREGALTEAL